MSRICRVALLAAVTFALLASIGCAKKEAEVKDAFPAVTKEPVITEPVVPPKWPYTGLEAPSASKITRRPLSVKIENSNAARPQTGLNSADVVYETIAEGGITRFNCIFHSKVPDQVGPVRSARLSDLWIVPQYDGMLFFSGANSKVLSRIRSAGIDNMSHGTTGALYNRVSFKSAPHNLYLDLEGAPAAAKKKGFETTAKLEPMEFGFPSTEATPTAIQISIPFSYYARIVWKWDADKRVYLRENSGSVHRDAATDKQVRATNVVVMWAKYTSQSKKDAAGSVTYDITLGGEGKAAIFKDGTRINGTWEAKRNSPPVFKDKEGKQVTLNPGTTWFEVPPTDVKISVKKPSK